MAKYYQIEHNGVTYHVRFFEERIWDHVDVFTFDPTKRFFKRKFKVSYIECILKRFMEIDYTEQKRVFDKTSPSFLYELAKYAVEMAARSDCESAIARKNYENQLEYINQYAVK